MPKQSGYSLIELLIVIAIVAIITAGLVPSLYSLSNSKGLQIESENLLSKLQNHRNKSIQGVESTWYGVRFEPAATKPVITFYNPSNPESCPIINRDLTQASGLPCTLEEEPYEIKNGVSWQMALTTISPIGEVLTQNINDPAEARFNRAQNSYQILLSQPARLNSPLLRRLRLTLLSGSQTVTIAIDGGNICGEKNYENSPFPCETYNWGGTRYYGGPKEGRIFLVN